MTQLIAMSTRRVLIALALGGTAAVWAHLIAALPIVRSFEALTYDRRLARTANPNAARSDIAIIEIDELSKSLKRMGVGLGAFRRYLSADLVRTLLASGIEAKPGGKRLTVTVMFTDLEGFTGAYDGEPVSESKLAESQKSLQDSMQKKAEEARKKLEDAQNAAKTAQ